MSSNSPHKLTVLQVVPQLATGGAERTTIEVAQAIVKSGGRALVWSAGGRLTRELEAVGGVSIIGKANSKNPLDVFVTNPKTLADIIKTEHVDIIHARSRAPAWSALIAARRTDTAFVTTYHGIYNAKSALKRWYNSVMVRGDRVIANSHFTKAHLVKAHDVDPAGVTVIYRGVDADAFDHAHVAGERIQQLAAEWGITEKPSRPRFILPARLTEWKGQRVLLAALEILRTRNYDFEAIFVGDAQGRDAYRDSLLATIAQTGLSEQVKLVGHCADMPAAFSLCQIAVTPSIEPEAFGRTAAEAQAMGLPVVASDLGGAKETIDPGVTGLLFPAGNAEALAHSLAQLLDMPEAERAAMGRAGAVRIRALFTTQSLQRDTLALYHELLRSKA